jgi:hypothetical protein
MTGYVLGDGEQVSHERVDFRKAICDGDNFNIEIRGVRMSMYHDNGVSFGDPLFAAYEETFLNILVNVLHLLSCSHRIRYYYPAIARNGIECTGNSVQDGLYSVSAIFPFDGGSLMYGCVCELKKQSAFANILFLPSFPSMMISSHPEPSLLASVDVLSNFSLQHNPLRNGFQSQEGAEVFGSHISHLQLFD